MTVNRLEELTSETGFASDGRARVEQESCGGLARHSSRTGQGRWSADLRHMVVLVADGTEELVTPGHTVASPPSRNGGIASWPAGCFQPPSSFSGWASPGGAATSAMPFFLAGPAGHARPGQGPRTDRQS